jgi:hypothetical protein
MRPSPRTRSALPRGGHRLPGRHHCEGASRGSMFVIRAPRGASESAFARTHPGAMLQCLDSSARGGLGPPSAAGVLETRLKSATDSRDADPGVPPATPRASAMQLRYLRTLAPVSDGVSKLSHLAWSHDKCAGGAARRQGRAPAARHARRARGPARPAARAGRPSGAAARSGRGAARAGRAAACPWAAAARQDCAFPGAARGSRVLSSGRAPGRQALRHACHTATPPRRPPPQLQARGRGRRPRGPPV